ncbi:HAD family phosphatase [Paenibacillus sambharensis]|uniref:HAD family phosphatase n=1 Tax=Paenibacillus sambharensis TaxID=1803190 RepID=A0A2W1LKS4_9BACL|nr:Cof-type HAD-IIB family hydrolase [Paenibacillus sambharensis]PZD95562.1 HAD family phosphatase [Paenibacillus sambharensis]
MRIIAIDLDGTLLSDDLTVHQKDVEAIREAQQREDLLVIIATGRALFDARQILDRYGLSCPVIASNGAQICVDDQLLSLHAMERETVRPMLEWLNAKGMYCQVYLPDAIKVSDRGISQLKSQLKEVLAADPAYKEDIFWKSIKAQVYQYGLEEVEGSIGADDYEGVIKLMIVSPDRELLAKANAYLQGIEGCVVSSSGTYNLEVMGTGVDKGTALQAICQHYGTSAESAVVIGDNQNDLPMFRVAGTGIAMGNARGELVQIATHHTLSNRECGVAHAFHSLILQPQQEPGRSGLIGSES